MRRGEAFFQLLVDEIAAEGQDTGHVEAVRTEGKDAAIAEEDRLHEQGYADAETCRPGAEENGHERAAHCVARRAAGQGDVEHHREKDEGRADA